MDENGNRKPWYSKQKNYIPQFNEYFLLQKKQLCSKLPHLGFDQRFRRITQTNRFPSIREMSFSFFSQDVHRQKRLKPTGFQTKRTDLYLSLSSSLLLRETGTYQMQAIKNVHVCLSTYVMKHTWSWRTSRRDCAVDLHSIRRRESYEKFEQREKERRIAYQKI